MYDIIGDIHGHADKLIALLHKLGYTQKGVCFQHPERKALFLGDYIDRGPDNPGVVHIVRAMVENKKALALMGNHEYNAILYNTMSGTNYLRKHSAKNNKQHKETLEQYGENEAAYQSAIAWFKTLPLFYEDENLRAIHACWHPPSVEVMRAHCAGHILNEKSILDSSVHSHPLYKAVEIGLKGLEAHLPDKISYLDKDGHKRQSMRLKWWEDPKNKSLQAMSVLENIELPDLPFTQNFPNYNAKEKPVFFGHYWLQGKPVLQKPNVCCLDYSVAKAGKLCAYRFDGEQSLKVEKIVFV